ncbi:MAG: response regulator [Bryobacteraceae bacterium]|jgi:DNA-binding NtrC family response regulator
MDNSASRILLVDDEPALLKMVGAYLGRLGYAVITANTTDKAWAEMEASPESIAVAVLDATMQGLSMTELATRMLKANASLRVLTASGYPVDISALEATAPGRVEFLHKPFTPEMLAAAIRRMLAAQEENL